MNLNRYVLKDHAVCFLCGDIEHLQQFLINMKIFYLSRFLLLVLLIEAYRLWAFIIFVSEVDCDA